MACFFTSKILNYLLVQKSKDKLWQPCSSISMFWKVFWHFTDFTWEKTKLNCSNFYCNNLCKLKRLTRRSWSHAKLEKQWRECLEGTLNADIKISQYPRLHIKIIYRRSHIITHFIFWDKRTRDMRKVCLQTLKNHRIR